MATLASATFRETALNSQFQIHRSHGQTDFSRQSDTIRVFTDSQGSGMFQTVGLGFWLTLAQFRSGEFSLAFNQELGFVRAFSERSKFYSALQDIPRFGLNSHYLT